MATARRLSFRLPVELERHLRSAAEATNQTLTEFLLGAAEERADDVLAGRTTMPGDHFDRLLAALDEPVVAMPTLREAGQRPRRFTPT